MTGPHVSKRLSQLSPEAQTKAREFLLKASEFHLGELPTEQMHPETKLLSEWCQDDLRQATACFQNVERSAYRQISNRLKHIARLSAAIQETINSGGRVFLCGCGATGRLSLTIETIWRELLKDQNPRDKLISFMAGGDYALVRSIENFEDHPEYGERQLFELGFRDGDLLVAITEGGETPFVIGAVEAASRFQRKPWFAFCNPSDVLERTTARSRRVLRNDKIEKLQLFVGPMAITGSTRLQASSVLMFAVGTAALAAVGLADLEFEFKELTSQLESLALDPLEALIKAEAQVYANQEFCLHKSPDFAITVFTDLTERSPTFSLPAFENLKSFDHKGDVASWTYFESPFSQTAHQAWTDILKRQPRTCDWPEFSGRYGPDALLGFDFSRGVATRRQKFLMGRTQHEYLIKEEQGQLSFSFQGHEFYSKWRGGLLQKHLILKFLLNLTSTLVMGRMHRFSGNVMLWVRASNFKLIDRSIRYVQLLLERSGRLTPYHEIAIELFDVLDSLGPQEAVVIKTYDRLK